MKMPLRMHHVRIMRCTIVADMLNEHEWGYCAIDMRDIHCIDAFRRDNLMMQDRTPEGLAEKLAMSLKSQKEVLISFNRSKDLPEFLYGAYASDCPPTRMRYTKTRLEELNPSERETVISALDELLRKDAAPHREQLSND